MADTIWRTCLQRSCPSPNSVDTTGIAASTCSAVTRNLASPCVIRAARPVNRSNGSPSTCSHTPDPANAPANPTASASARSAVRTHSTSRANPAADAP